MYITYQHIISYVEKPNMSVLFSFATIDDKSLTSTFNKHNFLLSLKPWVWIKQDSIFLSDSLGSETHKLFIDRITEHNHNFLWLTQHQIKLNSIIITIVSRCNTHTVYLLHNIVFNVHSHDYLPLDLFECKRVQSFQTGMTIALGGLAIG